MAKGHSFGTTFTWDGATIASLSKIGGLSLSADTTDVTTHDSTSAWEEVVVGILRSGEITVSGFLNTADTTGQVAMLTDFAAKSLKAWAITFPTAMGAAWSGNAYIVKLDIGEADATGAVPFSASIKITGAPTLGITSVTGMSAVGFSNAVLIMPTFAIGTYEYVVTITNAEVSTVVTPVDASDGEIITITTDGGSSQVVATGEASSACTLDVDDVTEIVVTITHATKAPKTYTFHCAVLAA